MTFGAWLRQRRLSKGYSLRELARRANDVCRHSYISQLESDTGGKSGRPYQPDIEIVDALAKALGESIDEARLAAGYAPTSTHYVSGFEIQLPDDVTAVIPHSQITSESEAAEFREAFLLAYEITKKRIADRDKEK